MTLSSDIFRTQSGKPILNSSVGNNLGQMHTAVFKLDPWVLGIRIFWGRESAFWRFGHELPRSWNFFM